ncbi:hydantoinase/oxoprolinase family protein [Cupriavidus basilensis]
MANAIKKISVRARLRRATRYTLQCFGGAGGQHACLVADALGMTRVFVHPLAGVLSAYGMGLADQNVIREQAVETRLDAAALPALDAALGQLAEAAQTELRRQACGGCAGRGAPALHVRYEGSDAALVSRRTAIWTKSCGVRVGLPPALRLPDAGARALVVEAVSVEPWCRGDAPAEARTRCTGARGAAARRPCRCSPRAPTATPAWQDAALVVREDMRPGDVLAGPAIIAEKNATTVVEPGWQASRRRWTT